MKNLLQIPCILIRHLKLVITHPFKIRHALIVMITWAVATLFAAATMGLDVILGDRSWWWYPVDGALLLVDVTMTRWAVRGYYWRRAADDEALRTAADRAEFERIISQIDR